MPVILKPLQYANTATWNGSGTSTVTVNFGFQPDLVWIKPRNSVASNANGHILIDSVRGVDKVLRSHTTGAEVTESNNITAFTSTGITIGDSHNVNKNTTSQYVAWAWKKGATQGFDIVTFTNTASSAAFNHSLGVTPAMIILKGRGPTAANWTVFHKSLANMTSAYLNLNSTGATGTLATGVPAPTSTTFGSSSAAIPASESSIAYLFSEVAGFSKFGSYTGNGSADGPFVFCGFRPKWIMTKISSASGAGWWIQDTTRDTFNPTNDLLQANLPNATFSPFPFDILSNGFKIRTTDVGGNTNGATYIFVAFAEAPFKNALAR